MVKVKNAAEIQRMIKEHPLELRRIFSITAHVDHGKSTACDYLMGRAGLMSVEYEGEKRLTDYDWEEKARGITIFTSVVLLSYEFQGQEYLLEINDTPGHISFTGEVSRALRGSDGAVILVDALEGIMTQTITNIGLSVGNEWCRPVLFINKVDRLIRELRFTPEEIIKRFQDIISEVNLHIEEVSPEPFKGKWTLDPEKGQVIFGSAKDGWGFSVTTLKKKEMSAKVVLEKYAEALESNDTEPIQWLKENLPLDEAMLELIINHLPSPIEAQKYRMIKIWSGDLKKALDVKDVEDPSEFKDDLEKWLGWSLINIKSDGPLLGMITKLFIHPKSKHATLIGRIFSGTLHSGDTIYLMNAKKSVRIRRLGIQEIDSLLPVDEIPAGNLFAMELPEIFPAGETFVAESMKNANMPLFEEIRYASDPVASQSIKPERPEDLAKLGDVVSKWVLADPTATFRKDQESGEYILSGIDPLQLEIITGRIKEEIPIKIGTPITIYYEGPMDRGVEIKTKCTEGHNKLKLYIEPLNKETMDLIRKGKINEYQDSKERAKVLREAAEWDTKEARRIWAIEGPNILVNGTLGVQRLDRIKSYVISSFRDFCFRGSLANEPSIGIKAVITDATIHEDPSHTRAGQIFIMTFSALSLAFLTSNPCLFEPILRMDIKVPNDFIGNIMSIITQHRGKIVDTKQMRVTAEIRAEIPASEAVAAKEGLGIASELRSATQGKAIFGYQFDRLQMLPKGMQYNKVIEIRSRKREEGKELAEDMPTPVTFKARMYPDWQSWVPQIRTYLEEKRDRLVIKEILDNM